MTEPATVEDADPDRHEQPRKNGSGNMLDEARQSEQNGREEQAVNHPG